MPPRLVAPLAVMLVVSCLATTGCATIVKGGRQNVTITSPTPNAEMSIRSFKGREVYSGPLPAKVRLQREDQYTVTITAPGHKEQKATITKSMSGWAFGNLIWIIPILWGVGIAVDAASGALWSLEPEDMAFRLVQIPPPPPPPQPASPEPPGQIDARAEVPLGPMCCP